MRTAFLNSPDDVQWLKDTALRGCHIPAKWAGFQSFVLQGNEDCPHAVNLYLSADPLYSDDYYRVRFDNSPPVYCTALEYDGATDKPRGEYHRCGVSRRAGGFGRSRKPSALLGAESGRCQPRGILQCLRHSE